MVAIIGNGTADIQSTNQPLLFNGINYTYWKARMKIHVQANDYDAWRAISQGIEMPSIIEDGKLVPKAEEDFDDEYTRKAQSNVKVMNLLYCVLSLTEFNRISECDTAK